MSALHPHFGGPARHQVVGVQGWFDNISMNFHCSEQGVLRAALLSGDRRNKLGNRFTTFHNCYRLSGLYDFVENSQTFCLEL